MYEGKSLNNMTFILKCMEKYAQRNILFRDKILLHFQEKGQTVTSARYSDMLVNELKSAIRSKRRGLLSKRVLLLHANARPHAAARTVDTLRALKFEVLKHPPYGPDLAPSDFHLFGPLKEHLRDQKFADDKVMEAVQSWLQATPKSFFLVF